MKNAFVFGFIIIILLITGCSNRDSRNNLKTTTQLQTQNRLQNKRPAKWDAIDLYRFQVAYEIQKRWVFSEKVPESKELVTAIIFKVMPNGKIVDIKYTDQSGNDALDKSAYNAINNSSPVEPFPENISIPYIEIGLRFTPNGTE